MRKTSKDFMDEKTSGIEEARKRHQQLRAKLLLWRKVYVEFQTNCLHRHAPKEQPHRRHSCVSKGPVMCELDDIYQPEVYAQEKLKLPSLEEIARLAGRKNSHAHKKSSVSPVKATLAA
ncbi:uncharacterized protein LOC134853555 [Symsagittifera roscoffensis]|uniref:uncharacterized protein LOC134853555 n=1 Tax=Symsagittifera roscoffensis TaxID=84072 RepID=UPI00307CB3D1